MCNLSKLKKTMLFLSLILSIFSYGDKYCHKAATTMGKYLDCLEIDTMTVLSEKAQVTSTVIKDKKTKVAEGVSICTYQKKGIGPNGSETKEIDEMLTTSPSGSLYPGAIITLDNSLVEGVPNIIGTSLPRKEFTLTINGLRGIKTSLMKIPESSISEVKGKVNDAIDNKLKEFLDEAQEGKGYGSTAGSGSWRFSLFSSAQQVAADLGFSYKGASAQVKAALSVDLGESKTTVFALYQQVFYNVTYQPSTDLNTIFHNLTPKNKDGWDEFTRYVNEKTPVGYIGKVLYGQMILVKMTFSDSLTAVEAKVEAQAKIAGEIEGNASVNTKNTKKNVDMEITLFGGNQKKYGEIIAAPSMDGLKSILKDMTLFNKETGAIPIAYVTYFLGGSDKRKEGRPLKFKIAKINFTGEYMVQNCKIYNEGTVEFSHDGAYIAEFKLEYNLNGEKKIWNSGHQNVGYKITKDIPAEAKDIVVSARSMVLINSWNEIFRKKWGSMKKCSYKIKGTTLNLSYDTQSLGRKQAFDCSE